MHSNTAETRITHIFLFILLTVFLLCDFGFSYTNITEMKYRLFLTICGGYCVIMPFVRLQKFAFGTKIQASVSADNDESSKAKIINAQPFVRSALHHVYNIRFELLLFLYAAFTIVSTLISPYRAASLIGMSRYEGCLTILIYCMMCLLVSKYAVNPNPNFKSASSANCSLTAKNLSIDNLNTSESSYATCAENCTGKFNKMQFAPCNHSFIFFTAASLSVIVFDIIAILQFAGLNPLWLYPDGLTYYDKYSHYAGAFISTAGNADLTAAFLSIAVPFFLILFVRCSKKLSFSGILYVAAFVLSTIVLIYSQVMAGILAVSATVILIFPLLTSSRAKAVPSVQTSTSQLGDIHKRKRRLKNKKYRIPPFAFCWYAALLTVFFISLLVIFTLNYQQSGIFYELHEILHGNFDDSFGTGRMYIYKNILSRIPEHLMWGTGPDTLSAWNIPDFKRYDSALGLWIYAHIDTAHNELLNILANQGLPALLSYICILICAFTSFLCSKKSVLSCACAAALVSYIIQSMFSFSMCITAPYFWILLGVLLALSKHNTDKTYNVKAENHLVSSIDSSN